VAILAVVFGVLAAAIVVALLAVASLSRDHADLQERNVPFAIAISTAALNAKAMANHERGYLLSGRREFIEEFEQGLLDVRTAFAAALITADGERQAAAAFKANAGFERWVWAVQGQFRTYQAGQRRAATTAALNRGRTLRKTYEASFADAKVVASNAIRMRNNPFASTGWVAIFLVSLFVVLAVCVGLTLWLIQTLKLASVDEPAQPASDPAAQPPSPVRALRR
jgi:methyl-accepting chemotaxis protein